MTETPPAKDNPMFLQLIMMLSTSAMQQLGKIVHPMTGKSAVDLEGARFSIDLLEMLEDKTRGRLSAGEARTLSEILTQLRLNFVETSKTEASRKPKAEAPAPAKAPPPQAEKPSPEPPVGDAGTPVGDATEAPGPAVPGEEHTPRFHKTYE